MRRILRVIVVCGCALAACATYPNNPPAHAQDQPQARAVAPATSKQPVNASAISISAARAVLDKYCITCHNERLKTAGLMLDKLDVAHVGDAAETWERVLGKLRAAEMPPPGRPRPDRDTYAVVSAVLENALDAAAAANPNPGRVAVHRLNRTEYTNAVRDLLGLEVDGKALLWADEPDQEGFDNVASVLSLSPALLEGYLSVAHPD
jgi:mono/diheme cytochrome c family protein